MASLAPPAPAGLPRRAFLAASAGLALLAAGCTAGSSGAPAVSTEEADRLAGQVAVQEAVVAAYAVATTADPALALSDLPLSDLAAQAGEQLDRLRAAAPSSTSSPSASSPAPPSPPPGGDVRTWLREQVAGAAASHAAACVQQTGARAALLGAVAAGLRGHEAALA
ncbi:hypothetical protein SAMN05660642_00022 [Geodermatophilus siccatus]|uniref:DUF4439 domain-containing protein n=1 Tax=Geodermatophilus siccatus TaxID=1137991 RepID=A0A1G9KH96_9ACTN|nr:hypothetical protein [Geodermatophilus siccatus]SDL48966.1 hypothetical protein SAMN05660642_00022 [Geodermatophilus siccatus]